MIIKTQQNNVKKSLTPGGGMGGGCRNRTLMFCV
jgi:hypothetical protein